MSFPKTQMGSNCFFPTKLSYIRPNPIDQKDLADYSTLIFSQIWGKKCKLLSEEKKKKRSCSKFINLIMLSFLLFMVEEEWEKHFSLGDFFQKKVFSLNNIRAQSCYFNGRASESLNL
jgi:hypothetical protein